MKFNHRIARVLALVAVLAVTATACGGRGIPGSGGAEEDDSSATTTTLTASADDAVTRNEVQAMIDASIEAYDLKIKEWVADGFISDDELEALVDEQFAELIDQQGFLNQADIDKIEEQLRAAGVSEDVVDKAIETLEPAAGPAPGDAGPNPCTNREGGTDIEQMLLDIGRELKMADAGNGSGVPEWRESFDDWQESDLQSVVDLWNVSLNDEDHLVVLQKAALARVYWCPGTEADGSVRSGVYRHQMTLPVGKVLHDFGNGVYVQQDCHNLTILITPPENPPGTPTTTTPTTTVPGTPTTTVPGTPTTTVPGTPTTTVPGTPKPPVTTVAPPPVTVPSATTTTLFVPSTTTPDVPPGPTSTVVPTVPDDPVAPPDGPPPAGTTPTTVAPQVTAPPTTVIGLPPEE